SSGPSANTPCRGDKRFYLKISYRHRGPPQNGHRPSPLGGPAPGPAAAVGAGPCTTACQGSQVSPCALWLLAPSNARGGLENSVPGSHGFIWPARNEGALRSLPRANEL